MCVEWNLECRTGRQLQRFQTIWLPSVLEPSFARRGVWDLGADSKPCLLCARLRVLREGARRRSFSVTCPLTFFLFQAPTHSSSYSLFTIPSLATFTYSPAHSFIHSFGHLCIHLVSICFTHHFLVHHDSFILILHSFTQPCLWHSVPSHFLSTPSSVVPRCSLAHSLMVSSFTNSCVFSRLGCERHPETEQGMRKWKGLELFFLGSCKRQ